MNRKILFNDGWEFAKSGLDENSPEELVFQPVDLPHDWLIYDTLNLYGTAGSLFYRRYRSMSCSISKGCIWIHLCT